MGNRLLDSEFHGEKGLCSSVFAWGPRDLEATSTAGLGLLTGLLSVSYIITGDMFLFIYYANNLSVK